MLQEGGLRTYLLAYGAYFHSLSLDQLCQMFELPEKQVRPSCVRPPLYKCVLTAMCVAHIYRSVHCMSCLLWLPAKWLLRKPSACGHRQDVKHLQDHQLGMF